jgi:extracellular elastinolytic metalloproteinase
LAASAAIAATALSTVAAYGATAATSAAAATPEGWPAAQAWSTRSSVGGDNDHARPQNLDARLGTTKVQLDRAAAVLRDDGGAINRLAISLGPQAIVSVNSTTGTPDNIGRLDGFLTRPSDQPAARVAVGYVRAHPKVFKLTRRDLGTLHLRRAATDINGVTHLSFTQRVDGIRVFGNGLRAHVTNDGRLISVQGAPVTHLVSRASSIPAAALTAEEARAAAVEDVAGARAVASVDSTGGGPDRATRWSNGDQANLVYFETPDGLRLGWATYARSGPASAYQHVIDASTGRVLYRHDTVSFDHGDALVVDQWPGAPRGGQQRTVNIINHGWLGENAMWLHGGYVSAFADLNDDDVAQDNEKTPVPGTSAGSQFILIPFTTSSQCTAVYLCTWDSDAPFSWRKNKNQDVTQAFYFANKYYEHLKAPPIGFTAQLGNFERAGGDPLLLNALDGADTDKGFPDGDHIGNANMSTPPDGIPPTMQTYLNHTPGTKPATDPYLPASSSDSADDIYHEYTHGLSNRLVVDASGNSTLNSLQAGAMGEAWSDFYAEDFLVSQGLITDTSASGEVLFDKYLSKNRPITRSEAIDCAVGSSGRLCTKSLGGDGGYTFEDIGHATGGPEVHADGEIWAQTLWDLRTKLGSDVTLRLVTEAMSLSPADPGFLDERNAILQADKIIYGSSHNLAIWRVFAHRGMGWFAASTDSGDLNVVGSTALPPSAEIQRGSVNGTVTDSQTKQPIAGAIVYIAGHNSGYIGSYSTVTNAGGHYSIPNVPAGSYPRVVATASGYTAGTEPANVPPGGPVTVDFSLVRDWAASSGGAQVIGSNGPDYSPDCGPPGAVDLSYGTGWGSTTGKDDATPTDTPIPKFIVIKLPASVDVTGFGVDPSNTCGDPASSSTRDYMIEVSTDGTKFAEIVKGTFTESDRGRVNQLKLDGPQPGVQFVRFWMLSPQVPDILKNCPNGAYSGCSFMDMTELEVYGSPAGKE